MFLLKILSNLEPGHVWNPKDLKLSKKAIIQFNETMNQITTTFFILKKSFLVFLLRSGLLLRKQNKNPALIKLCIYILDFSASCDMRELVWSRKALKTVSFIVR